MNRYIRQMTLPEIGLNGQESLRNACVVMIGAGGLGSVALPYLAAAGIGNITIIDHDTVDLHNLHRQTIFRMDQIGMNKALCAKAYLEAINPDVNCFAITEKLSRDNADDIFTEGTHTHTAANFDLILDGSDNFETKALLNTLSIQMQTPLITASVNQWGGQIGVFEGYRSDKPCYQCLFPDFPTDTKNCNEAGILGTSAGIIGMMQAHIALTYITEIKQYNDKNYLTYNLKTIRSEFISCYKNPSCPHCNHDAIKPNIPKKENTMPAMISIDQLNDTDTIIIDVRNPDELIADPLHNPQITHMPINIPLPEFISRMNELPEGKRLAFICAGNIRSRQAADYLAARGYDNVCVLDKFSV